MKLDPALRAVLEPAYTPCPGFTGTCQNVMHWDPAHGHVPRGFLGATGDPKEVELVLVYAEPADPKPGESHTGLASAYEFATEAFENGISLFHRNVTNILDSCWPGLSFAQQMRKTWLTETVLCSAPTVGGHVPKRVSNECGNRYLLKQLALFRHALVVALGSKARDRLRQLNVSDFLPVQSVAPPGCNHRGARESWAEIPKLLYARGPTVRSSGRP